MILNGYQEWIDLYTELLAYFHGQERDMILEDDPAYFYRGRFELGDYDTQNDFSHITVSYDLYPYKRDINTYVKNWLWDPFDFTKDSRDINRISDEFTLQNGTSFATRRINMPPTSAAYLCHITVYEKKPADADYILSIARLGYTDKNGIDRTINLYSNSSVPFTQFDLDLALDTNSFRITCTRGKVYIYLWYNLGKL